MNNKAMKYCDLVMKGGVTSDIVYPNAALEISKNYRFKSIGGTSGGAIAAAACAAAAVGDRRLITKAAIAQKAELVGFDGLRRVADKIASPGFIFGLFQPAPGSYNAFRMLVALTGNATRGKKFLALCRGIFGIAPFEILLIFGLLTGLGAYIGGKTGFCASALPALICALIGGAIFAIFRVARVARRNFLGLCSGMGKGSSEALTVWLHRVLQELSGQAADQPLTFNHLWRAPSYEGEPETERSITLEMITTSISHREPRSLPFKQGGFFFRRDQFEALFPKAVVDWMIAHSGKPVMRDGYHFHSLPADGDLPLLVAVRMSLSFPLLISAVPLYEAASYRPNTRRVRVAKDAPGKGEKNMIESADALTTGGKDGSTDSAEIESFRLCWFSDGGICSNFPVHLFDSPLPRWPTFAINLLYPGTGSEERQDAVFLPREDDEDPQSSYQSIGATIALKELSRFLFGIVSTMQNWRDTLQSRAPGHRGRIVHVSLDEDEGGLNLDMSADTLERISKKGMKAGQAFANFDFNSHYWVRWRNLASALQRYTIEVTATEDYCPKIEAFLDAYSTARTGKPRPNLCPFENDIKEKEAQDLLDDLIKQGRAWKDEALNLSTTAPAPLPQMQISPTY